MHRAVTPGAPIPVTAKLSKAFYERLGDGIANELVEWFNLIDAAYRSDLREVNELNFARFDAKLVQRLAQLEAKLEQRIAQLETKTEQRFAQFEAKTDQRFTQLEAKTDQRFAELDAKIDQRAAELKAEVLGLLDKRLSAQTRLMVLSWATLLAAVIGLGLQ